MKLYQFNNALLNTIWKIFLLMSVKILIMCKIRKYLTTAIQFLFHINACSYDKNFHGMQLLLNCTNKSFDVIAITKTRSTKTYFSQLTYISKIFTQIKTSAFRTLLYIGNHHWWSYKSYNDWDNIGHLWVYLIFLKN